MSSLGRVHPNSHNRIGRVPAPQFTETFVILNHRRSTEVESVPLNPSPSTYIVVPQPLASGTYAVSINRLASVSDTAQSLSAWSISTDSALSLPT